MAVPDSLRRLLTAPGPSGYEDAPAAVWRAAAESFASVERVDTLGSCVARVGATEDGPSLAVVGHIDEIGLLVRHIDDDGYLHFTSVGGWDPQVLVGQRIEVVTRGGAVPGVIGKKPIHLLEADERKKVAEIKGMHIDIGAADGEEARELVRVGDVAVIAGEPLELPNGRIASRSLDNRLGSYVALEVARRAAEAGGTPGEVMGVVAAQEEIGLKGAGTAAFALRPDVAIAVDVTFATDQPGIEVKQLGKHELGSGAVIHRGVTIDAAVSDTLVDAAEEQEIPHTIEATSGRTSTDADALYVSRSGIPTGLVSIPLRYMHSPVEVCELDDVEACVELIVGFARRLTPGTAFGGG